MLVIPPGIIASLGFVSYQFRITNILSSHLTALENEMNNHIEHNVHMWNSSLVEVHMDRNNLIYYYTMLSFLFHHATED